MSSAKKLMGTTAVGGGALAIEDVFSTYLYTGNGSTQTITNGIDLAGEGGMVWAKGRVTAGTHNAIMDTERGTGSWLATNLTGGNYSTSNSITSFNSDGFSLGADNSGNFNYYVGEPYASWTFRKAPRFFDVVTYTGNGTSKTISHNLGVVPGMVVVKRTDSSDAWCVNHRYDFSRMLFLNLTSAATLNSPYSGISVTDTTFTVNGGTAGQGDIANNFNGDTYVAYLFAHDPLGPSGDGSDGLIACGSYTGNGSTVEIDLGWEPQWILVKKSSSAGAVPDWHIYDNMRGISTNGIDPYLRANLSDAEFSVVNNVDLTPTGFMSNANISISGETYIYIAIRRGPMRQPESGTEVFDVETKGTLGAPAYNSGFPVDMLLVRNNKNTTSSTQAWDRLRSTFSLTDSTAAEEAFSSGYLEYFAHNDGFDVAGGPDSNDIAWMFRRAPGFFDVVAYTGDGVAGRTVSHNLGVAPEFIITKNRTYTGSNWICKHILYDGTNTFQYLNLTSGGGSKKLLELGDSSGFNVWPNSAQHHLSTNYTGDNFIAYLFATLPGVSKVGSYTGNGTSQTINCGFTTGARFILIKRTDSTGDWYVWDTKRGIVAGNDPHMSLNTTAAEVTTDDSVDPDSSGFIVNQVAATNINVSSATYIFYAIA